MGKLQLILNAREIEKIKRAKLLKPDIDVKQYERSFAGIPAIIYFNKPAPLAKNKMPISERMQFVKKIKDYRPRGAKARHFLLLKGTGLISELGYNESYRRAIQKAKARLKPVVKPLSMSPLQEFKLLKDGKIAPQAIKNASLKKMKFIGVEIECYIEETHEYIQEYFDDMGVAVNVKHDGSLNDNGVEITALLRENNFKAQLAKICQGLKKLGATIDSKCGLHVHLDMRKETELSQRACIRNLNNARMMLAQLVPASRRTNSYCSLSKCNGRSRYYAINTQALKKFNTVEVRLHSGTVDFEKISNWIDLLLVIRSTPQTKEYTSLDAMFEKLGLTDAQIDYWLSRAKKFSDKTNNAQNETAA